MTETAISTLRNPTFPEDGDGRPSHESRGECSECGGEGVVEVMVGSAVNRSGGDLPYVPVHEAQTCGECEGGGWLIIERCAICRRPSEPYPNVDEGECVCTEEAVDAFIEYRAAFLRLIDNAAKLQYEARNLEVYTHPGMHDAPLGMVMHVADAFDERCEAWRDSRGFYIVADIPTPSGGIITTYSERVPSLPEWDADDGAFPKHTSGS